MRRAAGAAPLPSLRGSAALFLTVCLLTAVRADAGVATGHVLQKHVPVCFVGDALSKRPFRVMQILASIQQFQYVANVHFEFLGTCPPSRRLPNGNDYFAGDIRVVIPDINVNATVPVPGKGCEDHDPNNDWVNWSYYPEFLEKRRSCLYTLKLGDNGQAGIPWINTALHEFGHGLGLLHEHERRDVDRSLCNDSAFGGKQTTNLVTPYDPHSVMHYKMCAINGNYDNTGLSPLDQLTLHILYPEDDHTAEFAGTTVLRAGERLALRSAWKLRGANMAFAAKDFDWKIDGRSVGTKPDIDLPAPAGTHTLAYSYRDFLGRSYEYSGSLSVLSPDEFTRRISGPVAARAVLY